MAGVTDCTGTILQVYFKRKCVITELKRRISCAPRISKNIFDNDHSNMFFCTYFTKDG